MKPDEAQALITKDPRNKDVLFPYLIGQDLNSDPSQTAEPMGNQLFRLASREGRTYPD